LSVGVLLRRTLKMQHARYGLPDFDDGQPLEYLSLSEAERALACSHPGLHAQVYCVLQIGYFKAKHALFHFAWSDIQDDCAFALTRYFIGQGFKPHPITKHEHFAERVLIAEPFGYQLWSADFLPPLVQQGAQVVRRDVTPGFIMGQHDAI
jgi:hypothetical protein